MAKLINNQDLDQGTVDIQDIIISKKAKKIEVKIDRTYLLDSELGIGVQLFISVDNGVSFLPWGGFGTVGGKVVDPDTQQAVKTSSMVSGLPPEQGFDYIARTTVTLTKLAKISLDVGEHKEQ